MATGTLDNRFPTRVDLVEAAFGGLLERWANAAVDALRAEDPWQSLVQLIVRATDNRPARS